MKIRVGNTRSVCEIAITTLLICSSAFGADEWGRTELTTSIYWHTISVGQDVATGNETLNNEIHVVHVGSVTERKNGKCVTTVTKIERWDDLVQTLTFAGRELTLPTKVPVVKVTNSDDCRYAMTDSQAQ